MKKLLILLFSILISFNSSSGASDEPTQYVYAIYDHNDALKYTISKGDMDSSGCFFSQMIFSKEAQNAMKNNLTIDFRNSEFTPTSIDLYKNKVYWVDLDLNTKIKNNFVKMGNSSGDQLLELIHQDDELIFRMKMSNNGSTAVCDFPFRKLEVELDEDGLPVKNICFLDDDIGEEYTGKNVCKYENGQIHSQGMFKEGKQDGKWTSWHENGQIWSEDNWKDDKYDGKMTYWYEDGQIHFEKNYKDGKLDGKYSYWHENGQIKFEATYKDGKCISGDC